MNRLKKIVMLVLIVAVASFGLVGCKDKKEHPTGDHPSKEAPSEEHPTTEHPAGEHPK